MRQDGLPHIVGRQTFYSRHGSHGMHHTRVKHLTQYNETNGTGANINMFTLGVQQTKRGSLDLMARQPMFCG